MNQKEETSFTGLKTMQLNDQKAGMEGLDKKTINKIIYKASEGTPYFAFQEKRQKSIDSKVCELLLKMKNISESKRKEAFAMINTLCTNLEEKRDLSHSIVHIDMDAFYAAVEMNDNPSLKDKPMAVGSLSMLSTSNYLARKYGVRAAMPGFIAKKLCPYLVIVPTHFGRYRAISDVIRKIVEYYDPNYNAASLDEVYLDLTEYINDAYRKQIHEAKCLKNYNTFLGESSSHEDPCIDYKECMTCIQPISSEERDKMAFDIVKEIRHKIFLKTNLTASAGIAPNTMLAKVCSDKNKPNGQYQVVSSIEAVKSFISTLPVKKVSGIGPVQGQILNAIGIVTCEDMWCQRYMVANLFSDNSVDFYMRVALGIGSINVKSDYDRKSIGNERTFKDISKPEELHKKCEELCWNLIEDLKSHNLMGKLVVLKIKTSSFKTFTRNYLLPFYTADFDIIFSTAQKLLDAEIFAVAPQPLKLRLMGVRMCNVVPADSISFAKKQITLKSFLQSKSASCSNAESSANCEEQSICPICMNILENSSSDFNDHVNSCINDHTFCEQLGKTADSTLSKVACNIENLTVSPDKITSKIEKYFCPVCNFDQKVTGLIELNQHIDNCLNKKEIKQILANDLQNAEKRKFSDIQNNDSHKDVKKVRKIDDYFKQV